MATSHPLRRIIEPADLEEVSEEGIGKPNSKGREALSIWHQERQELKAMAGPGSRDCALTMSPSNWTGKNTTESSPSRYPKRSSCGKFEKTA